jgi:hypothetical protein
MIRKYIEKIGEKKNVADMEELGDMLAEIIEKTKESHHQLYEKYKLKLYEMAFGKKISQDMAREWVKEMEPVGLHWDMDETTNAMYKLGYNCEEIDFFVVANMIYNDYHDIVKNDDELALKMAYDWLADKDAKEDKLYNYWKYVVKRD